jgi:D-xylose transport system permease protein
MSTVAPGPPASVKERDESGGVSLGVALRRLAEGELGSARVLIVLAVIWTIFGIANSNFLTAQNLVNLTLQIAAIGTISVGVVLVLLLGEIDLSVGAVAGVTSAAMAVVNVQHGWNPYLAMLLALLMGAGIGLIQGSLATQLEIPSFVVTLAGLLFWQGLQLKILGESGTVNINNPAITNIANVFLADWLSWVLALAGIALIVALTLMDRARRTRAGLELDPFPNMVIRIGASAVAIVAGVWVLNKDRGVPLALVILLGIVLFFDYVTQRTAWGRHVYAVGGNAEAARRAGIRVPAVRTSVFVLASTLAAAGGIVFAARLFAVNQSTGGSDTLLLAIAGPVVAGVSLFGGRGRVWAALLGALVIGSISNGMDLLGLATSVKFMVTGAVLAAAVSLDALAQRTRRSHGRL